MSPTPRAAWLVGLAASSALFVEPAISVLAVAAVLVAIVVDALTVRLTPRMKRVVPRILSRGVPSPFEARAVHGSAARVRQPAPPDLDLDRSEQDGALVTQITARRRGRHVLPELAVRTDGPLGLGRWFHSTDEPQEVLVYPDLPAARRLAVAVRETRFRHPGLRGRGPIGLGTDFESIRDYLPDDDIRQVNWAATARFRKPMSNQYRLDQERELICLIDTGRLTSAPLGDKTRLDAAVDAATAIALVADVLGDRCGAIAFDREIRRDVRPRRKGAGVVVQALFDLEPRDNESNYQLAFRTIGEAKRSYVLVLTDLLEEVAARPLVRAVPILAKRHYVVIASAIDPDIQSALRTEPSGPHEVYAASVAGAVMDARSRAIAAIARAGAHVVEAAPSDLSGACVASYLSAKGLSRL